MIVIKYMVFVFGNLSLAPLDACVLTHIMYNSKKKVIYLCFVFEHVRPATDCQSKQHRRKCIYIFGDWIFSIRLCLKLTLWPHTAMVIGLKRIASSEIMRTNYPSLHLTCSLLKLNTSAPRLISSRSSNRLINYCYEPTSGQIIDR